jgi:GT2 family glycosyltransferase
MALNRPPNSAPDSRNLGQSHQVAVVILNWNAAEDTIRCVHTLERWQQVRPRIWVVDNASQGDDVARITAACADVTVLANQTNAGFAGGTNRGMAAALAAADCPILLLNNDATLTDANAAHLLATLSARPDAGIVGPLLFTQRERRLIAAGSRNPVLHHKNLLPAPLSSTDAYPVDYISGSVALIRPELLHKVGLLDEAYFFTMELADLSVRARAAGYRTLVAPGAEATHDLQRSAGLRSTLYTYYIVRNRFRYIRKFYRLAALPLTLVWLLYGVLLSAKLRVSGDAASGRAVWLGTSDGVRGRWGGQNDRVLAACRPGTQGARQP